MPEYDNTNSGLLFKSTSEHPKAPAFSGFWTDENNNQIKIKAYWSKNPDKNGNLFLQVSEDKFEPEAKEQSPQSGYEKAKAVAQQLKPENPEDKWGDSPINLDDIPF
jgi:hypothetical protein